MSTYFITGGAGFVGFAITQKLLREGAEKVVLYDAYKHYIPLEQSKWFHYQSYRFRELERAGDRVVTLRGDTTDRGLLKECIQRHTPRVLFHLAALPIASVSNSYPEEARQNVFESTCTLLEVLRELEQPLDRLVYASSSMVYGDFQRDGRGRIVPAREEQSCSPVGIYGAMKVAGEQLVRVYGRRFGLPYTIIRPSAIYGPTDCNRRVTEIFLSRALAGEPLTLDNGGLHELDFTYVEDAAEGFVRAAHCDDAVQDTFNITRGEGRSLRALAEVVADLVPGVELVDRPATVYRPNRGALDISKARDRLGFHPRYSLEEGMAAYLDFVRKNG